MNAARTIARLGLQEAVRRRVFLIVAVLTVAYLVLYGLCVWQAFQEVEDEGFGPSGFAAAAEAAGLRVESVRYTNFLVFPSPLDELLPGVAARLGERLEGAPAALGRVLATQVVYVAQKPVDVRAEL